MASQKFAIVPRDADADKDLPIYTAEGGLSAQPLPLTSASPNEVREYIANLLISHGRLEPDQARSIAARWRTGSGMELRKYPATMYREIFGHEDTWVVYRHVRLQVLANVRLSAPAKKSVKPPEVVSRKTKSTFPLSYIALSVRTNTNFVIADSRRRYSQPDYLIAHIWSVCHVQVVLGHISRHAYSTWSFRDYRSFVFARGPGYLAS